MTCPAERSRQDLRYKGKYCMVDARKHWPQAKRTWWQRLVSFFGG